MKLSKKATAKRAIMAKRYRPTEMKTNLGVPYFQSESTKARLSDFEHLKGVGYPKGLDLREATNLWYTAPINKYDKYHQISSKYRYGGRKIVGSGSPV